MGFVSDFVWGTATASYQVEGAHLQDGKGLSIWDMVVQKGGFVLNGDTGDIACDHYNRYREDIAMMKEIGVKGYRFSLSWPRIMPDGVGKINAKGLDFYDNLVDALLENGIEPYITLFHWDYPLALFQQGGWLSPDSPKWFAEYTKVVVDRLSDKITHWMTLNEPQCFVGLGHFTGVNAPGLKLDFSQMLTVGHHAMLAHGMAVEVIRKHSKLPAQIGYAPVGVVRTPATNCAGDIKAAREATFSIKDKHFWNNTWWMDPIFLGQYPEDGLKLFEADMPKIGQDDLKIISQPIDYFGVNIYNSVAVKCKENGEVAFPSRLAGYAKTAYHWSVTPESLYWGPRFFYERYQKPIIITENGMSNCDWVSLDGKVHDPQRIDFVSRYLMELKRAAQEGIPIKGYFLWTLMDNFEWAEGYNQRFGLVHVDFQSQKRTPKDSAYWYQQIIATNGEML